MIVAEVHDPYVHIRFETPFDFRMEFAMRERMVSLELNCNTAESRKLDRTFPFCSPCL